jgi:APA family basic amino acid/polyamine antiporter
MGEMCAWIMGWVLTIEYLVGASTVAASWSGYFSTMLKDLFGIVLDPRFTNAPYAWMENRPNLPDAFEINLVSCPGTGLKECGAIINIPAFCIIIAVTILLLVGLKQGAMMNTVFVVVETVVILVFIGAGFMYIKNENYDPYIPPLDSQGNFGWYGVIKGATIVFMAFIGFDTVSTTAQEVKNPQKDLPLGIMGSLAFVSILYVGVSFVLTGVVNYQDINKDSAIAQAAVAMGAPWLIGFIEVGSVASLTSVSLVSLVGQPRIFQAMADDGLLPASFGKINKSGVPAFSTIVTGVACAIFAALLPVDVLCNVTAVGTLFSYLIVCVIVLMLRIKQPNAQRGFKIPFGVFGGYAIPLIGILSTGGLIVVSSYIYMVYLLAWIVLGLLIYFSYGYHYSKMGKKSNDNQKVSQKL